MRILNHEKKSASFSRFLTGQPLFSQFFSNLLSLLGHVSQCSCFFKGAGVYRLPCFFHIIWDVHQPNCSRGLYAHFKDSQVTKDSTSPSPCDKGSWSTLVPQILVQIGSPKSTKLCPLTIANPLSGIWVFPKTGVYTPKSSILIGFSLMNHPFWGTTIFGNTHILTASTDFSIETTRPISHQHIRELWMTHPNFSSGKKLLKESGYKWPLTHPSKISKTPLNVCMCDFLNVFLGKFDNHQSAGWSPVPYMAFQRSGWGIFQGKFCPRYVLCKGETCVNDAEYVWNIFGKKRVSDLGWNMMTFPIPSMYDIFTYVWLKCMVNVGRYTIHGSYGFLGKWLIVLFWFYIP